MRRKTKKKLKRLAIGFMAAAGTAATEWFVIWLLNLLTSGG